MAACTVALLLLLLALPGYAVLRRCCPECLQAGAPGAFALSALASYAVLTPISAAGYALHLPLWALALGAALAIVAAAVDVARSARWPPRLPRPSLVASLSAVVIATDALMALRTGSHLEGDALHHRGRIRMLLAYGFNSLDPLIQGRVDDVYRGNLHHALLAATAQVTGSSATEVWAYSWFWAKLACAGAISHLTWAVLRDRKLAWIAAAAFALYMASSSVLPYVNSLAVYWLISLAAAFAVQLQTEELRWPAAAGLGAVALVCAQMHLLYYAFTAMIAGPALVFALGRAQLRRAAHRRALLVALLALGLGLPWLGASVLERGAVRRARSFAAAVAAPAVSPAAQAPPAVSGGTPNAEQNKYRGFLRLPNGQLMLDPSGLSSPRAPHVQLLAALAIGLFTARRRAVLAMAALALVAFAALYVPPLCTALVALAREPWVVRRLAAVLHAFYLAAVPFALFLWIGERIARSWLEPLFLGIALTHAFAGGVDEKPWARDQYLANALDGSALRTALQEHARRRAAFREYVPRGAMVLTPRPDSARLTAECDCYPLATTQDQGIRGILEMNQRRLDADRLLNGRIDLRLRAELLRKYGIAAVWARGKRMDRIANLFRPLAAREVILDHERLLVLDPARVRAGLAP